MQQKNRINCATSCTRKARMNYDRVQERCLL
jgi:hypothetical protein